jgi:hypothetical protein
MAKRLERGVGPHCGRCRGQQGRMETSTVRRRFLTPPLVNSHRAVVSGAVIERACHRCTRWPPQNSRRREDGAAEACAGEGTVAFGKSTGAPSFFVGCSSIALSANGEKGTLAVTPFAEGSRRGGSEVADCVGAEIRYGTVRGSLAVGCCMTLCGPVG